MRVPYGEGLASHIGPESCVCSCKAVSEALTGESAGQVLSRESSSLRGVDDVKPIGRQNRIHRYRKVYFGLAWSKTLCTNGSFPHGNREIPYLASADGAKVRAANPKGARQR
jgi:hypothetical protein